MAVAAPVTEQVYRYRYPSTLVAEGERRHLRLATSGGPAANPRLFQGRLLRPVVASDLLLTLGDVARSRFHVPPAMLAHILELADPVATCGDDRLRFETFSACCSVYGRVDLVPEAWDGEALGRGTTNVDFGPGVRAALASVQERGLLELSLGADELAVRTDAGSAVERRVSLPSRWLRGFLEVGIIQAGLRPAAEVDGAAARLFLRSIPAAPPRGPVWVAPSGQALRTSRHDPGQGAIRLAGLGRLRLLSRAARHATGLRVFAGDDGSTAWQADVPGARVTLVLSPDVWRGLSGEGRALHALARDAAPAGTAAVRAALGWAPRLDAEALATTTGRGSDEVAVALATLSLSGIVGYDLAEQGYFRRELPFDLGRIERLQPRLRDARRLVERGAVMVEDAGAAELADGGGLAAWVRGAGDVDYRVRLTADGWACTCPWYGSNRAERGPCKHVLAVQLVAADAGDG
jgi:hypothetical protein